MGAGSWGANLFLGVLGASGGFLVSGGVFTVLVSVGLIPRFAGKTHTSRKMFLYEEAVVLGTLIGDVLSIFDRYMSLPKLLERFLSSQVMLFAGDIILILFGLFAGIFVGCLALAIAEMLNSIPIFARRISFRHGIGIVILAMGLGKLCGSLLYFSQKVFLFGG